MDEILAGREVSVFSFFDALFIHSWFSLDPRGAIPESCPKPSQPRFIY